MSGEVEKYSFLPVEFHRDMRAAARAAEVDSVAVTYGAHPEEGLRACKPLNCFPSVSSLSAWLKQNA